MRRSRADSREKEENPQREVTENGSGRQKVARSAPQQGARSSGGCRGEKHRRQKRGSAKGDPVRDGLEAEQEAEEEWRHQSKGARQQALEGERQHPGGRACDGNLQK